AERVVSVGANVVVGAAEEQPVEGTGVNEGLQVDLQPEVAPPLVVNLEGYVVADTTGRGRQRHLDLAPDSTTQAGGRKQRFRLLEVELVVLAHLLPAPRLFEAHVAPVLAEGSHTEAAVSGSDQLAVDAHRHRAADTNVVPRRLVEAKGHVRLI